jgi:TPP-dependent pyruvate/acetoin dehydrogenase alpha subunit
VTKEELINFENKIAEQFNLGKIRAPVHLYYGNEEEMINVFKNIREEDWIFCSWRSHYQCLLKGVPAAEIEKEIMEGRSISLCFPKYKVYSSAIVGGILPIAIGTALSIKRSGEDSKVYCFMGDMTSETGIAHESIKYAIQHKLPIKFIIEDNTKSVCTDTREVWNNSRLIYEGFDNDMIYYYKYETKYPHAGAGVRVQF